LHLEPYLEKLTRGEWEPRIALVYGEEELGVDETFHRIVKALESKEATRIDLEGKKLDTAALGDELSQMGLFAERRFTVLHGVPSRAEGMADLLERVERTDDLFLLVRHDGDLDKRLRWYKRAKGVAAVFRHEAVKEREMPDRIRERARTIGLKMSVEPAQALASRVGTDLLTARNELEKLRLFTSPRTEITAADVEAVVGRSRDTILYEITEGISDRDRARSLADLKDLLRQGFSAGAILSFLAREVRFLLQAKIVLSESRGLGPVLQNYNAFSRFFREQLTTEEKDRFGKGRGALLHQHPYVVFLRLRQASRFAEGELLRLLAAFSRADRAVKSGAGSEETVLFATVAAASAGGGRPS